jgi:hypothetical protein
VSVVITDRRAILTDADTATNFNVGAVNTDSFAESTTSVAFAYNEAEGSIYYTTGTSIDMSDMLMYVYSSVVATQDNWTGGVHGLIVGDSGTNLTCFNQQGNNRRVFSHSDGPVGWSNFVLDGAVAKSLSGASQYRDVNGTLALLDLTAINKLGAHFITLSKALGGGVNCYVDIIRYGNDGIYITSGTSSSAGTFLQACIEDRSTDDQKAHGVIRELGAGVYSSIGPITIGNSGTPTETIFSGSGIVVSWEDRDIADGKYYFNVEGTTGALTEFGLTASTLSSSGPSLRMNFASGNIDTFALNGVSFNDLRESIQFSFSADASAHTIDTCTFNNCDQIDLGKASFTNIVVNDTAALSANSHGAIYIATGETFSNVDGVAINNYNAGIGLWLADTVTGTVSMSNWIFDGSGYVDVFWEGTVGTLTINLDSTSNPNSWDSNGGTVEFVSTTNYTLTNLQPDTEVRIYTSGTTDDITTAGDELYSVESATGSTTFQYGSNVITSGYSCVVMIHNVQYETIRFTVDLLGTDTSQQIQQQFDRNYENPE